MAVNEFALKSLINNELFFGLPNAFNDPLDCKFTLRIPQNMSIEGAIVFYNSVVLSEAEKEMKLELFKKDTSQIRFGIEANYTEYLRQTFPISCFSEKL